MKNGEKISETIVSITPSAKGKTQVKSKKEILETRDYSIFKLLSGNRTVEEYRVLKIIESIKTVGYITNPIIVNEYFEVIDGQTRLEALRRLGLKVEYIIVEGIGIAECVAMNLFQKNWGLKDFINSFAEQGNENYIKLRKLMEAYKDMPTRLIFSCASSKTYANPEKNISNGKFIFDNDYKKAAQEIEEVSTFEKYRNNGLKRQFLLAMLYVTRNISDTSNLRKKFDKYSFKLRPFSTYGEALASISEIYNIGLSELNKRYFDIEWRRGKAQSVKVKGD